MVPTYLWSACTQNHSCMGSIPDSSAVREESGTETRGHCMLWQRNYATIIGINQTHHHYKAVLLQLIHDTYTKKATIVHYGDFHSSHDQIKLNIYCNWFLNIYALAHYNSNSFYHFCRTPLATAKIIACTNRADKTYRSKEAGALHLESGGVVILKV